MSDIKKGYTFTDKSTDWVSNKETAIRLNKMVDDAKLNLVAGTNITITPTANGPSIAATGGGTGTVTSVNLTAGTGVSVSGGPITTSGSITVNNTAPDQVVSLTGAGTTTVTGTYPSFTISSADSTTGTVTSVAATAGTGITVSGSPITTSGTLTITNSAPDQTVVLSGGTGITTSGTYPSFTVTNSAPDQTVSISGGTGITTSGTYPSFTVTNSNPDQTVSLTGAGTTVITGTYPSFTVTSNDAFTGTVTSVAATAGTGITISGSPITSSGTLSITNSAPDQVVSLTGTGTTTVTGTYPSFTINSADQHVGTVTAVTGTLPIVSSGGTAPDISINAATNLLPGSMSAADKSKLDAATNANTASAIVSRDVSGNFSAGTITANLTGNVSGTSGSTTGNAATATALQTARQINGVNFDGTANITVTAAGSTLSDTVPIGKGGTGQTAANAAFNALAPSQTGNSGKYLTTNGTDTSWAAVSGGAGGTVTSVSVTTANGVSGTVANPTTTPAISLSLGAITPTSVAASGAVSGSNLSGTNTGDQTNISGNAATVTTNANLTGPITSVGNATSVAAQTGTGSTFVMQASPTLTTPALGTPTSGLLNSCTSNINATGNVARTFQARAGDVFNINDFGASPSASAATNTTAIVAAFTAANTAGTGCVFVPQGVYLCNKITVVLTASAKVSFVGTGQSSSVLSWAGTDEDSDKGFKITLTALNVNNRGAFEIQDLCFLSTGNKNAGTAIEVIQTEPEAPASHNMPSFKLLNCLIRSPMSDGYWSKGVSMQSCHQYIIDNCFIVGRLSGTPEQNYNGTAIFHQNFFIGGTISNCNINYWGTAVESTFRMEGLQALNNYIIEVNRGFKIYGISTEFKRSTAFFAVLNNMDCRGTNPISFDLDGVQAAFLTNNTIIQAGGTNIIKCQNVFESSITANTIFGNATNGILFATGTIVVQPSSSTVVSGNIFRGQSNSVVINSDSHGITVANNRAGLTADYNQTTNYLSNSDSGVNNLIGETRTYTGTVTPSGSTTTQDINVDITANQLGSRPLAGAAHVTSYVAADAFFDYDNSTKTSARITLSMKDGSNLPNVPIRWCLTVGPSTKD